MTDSDVVSASFDVYGMLGNPVSQTQTPRLFNAYCRNNGIASIMVPLKISDIADLKWLLKTTIESQTFSGFVSTIPFKENLYSLCDILGPASKKLHKVNTVKISEDGKVAGEMFDGIGFVQALRDKGFIFSNARCLIIGCGAAGQAIGAELLRNNVAHCQIVDPNMQALESFDAMTQEDSARIFTSQRPPDHISSYDLVVNSSPIGMTLNDPMPVNLIDVRKDCFVGDCVTNFETTAFIKSAKQIGCTTVNGAEMAKGQLASILDYFGISKL